MLHKKIQLIFFIKCNLYSFYLLLNHFTHLIKHLPYSYDNLQPYLPRREFQREKKKT